MENPAKVLQETQNPSPQSYRSNSSNGGHRRLRRPSPLKSTPIIRSEVPNDPHDPATTFVQAEPSSFKQVVQMLTGSSDSDTARRASSSRHDSLCGPNIPPIKTGPKKEKHSSKLYERRKILRKFNISSLTSAGLVKVDPQVLSPSILDFPSLVLSPVTPLIPDPFKRERSRTAGHCNDRDLDMEAEDKAIKEKRFYMHPSPANTPEPRLLPLFPITSPRVERSPSWMRFM